MKKSKFFGGKTVHAISAVVIVIIIVVAVIVVGVGVYIVTRGNETNANMSPTPTPITSATPSPTASVEPTSTATPTASSTAAPEGLGNATSYEFNATETSNTGALVANLYYATKNLGTSNEELIWVVSTPSTGTTEYIINGIEQKAWIYSNGNWTDYSSSYAVQQSSVELEGTGYADMLAGYGGTGSFSYTVPAGQQDSGDNVLFTNIQINPSIPDASFQPPS